MVDGWDVVAGNVKEVGDRTADGNETLKLSRGFEALHDPLSPPDRLMGVFCPIVQSLVRGMLDAWHHLPLGCTVGSQLVSDHHSRRTSLSFQKLSHQTPYSLGIAAPLLQNVKDEVILIDSAPKPLFLTGDGDDNLIEVPLIA